jgi:hypothetical protein
MHFFNTVCLLHFPLWNLQTFKNLTHPTRLKLLMMTKFQRRESWILGLVLIGNRIRISLNPLLFFLQPGLVYVWKLGSGLSAGPKLGFHLVPMGNSWSRWVSAGPFFFVIPWSRRIYAFHTEKVFHLVFLNFGNIT